NERGRSVEGVLDVLASLLHRGLSLIKLSFAFEILVLRRFTSGLFGLAGDVFSGVLCFVCHSRGEPFRRGDSRNPRGSHTSTGASLCHELARAPWQRALGGLYSRPGTAELPAPEPGNYPPRNRGTTRPGAPRTVLCCDFLRETGIRPFSNSAKNPKVVLAGKNGYSEAATPVR